MPPLIELDDICFGYPGHPNILNGISLRLDAGERLCIAGHNGSGKSTLLHVMVGLLRPAKGTILAFGRERRKEEDFHEVRRLAGLVFQDPDDQLFCPTVAEDVAFGPLNLGKSQHEAMTIVDGVLESLHLTQLRNHITHKLSGGEKRLVTLAAVMAMEPKVLLLDEPSNGVDESTTDHLADILRGLPQAMIAVSHDPHFRQKIATRTLRLSDGGLAPPVSKCSHKSGEES